MIKRYSDRVLSDVATGCLVDRNLKGGRRALMRETTIRIQVSIQTSTLSEIERAPSALLYTHKIAHKTNEISRRSDRKDGGKRHGCGKERGGGE